MNRIETQVQLEGRSRSVDQPPASGQSVAAAKPGRSSSAASSAARPATSAPKSTTRVAGCVQLQLRAAAMRRTAPPQNRRTSQRVILKSGQGLQARDPPSALAPDLRVRVVAHGSVGALPVPRTSFWARFLFEHCACFRPVHRVAAWMSALADGLVVTLHNPEAVRAAVRAAGRGDPCAPEQGGAAPCRRDQL